LRGTQKLGDAGFNTELLDCLIKLPERHRIGSIGHRPVSFPVGLLEFSRALCLYQFDWIMLSISWRNLYARCSKHITEDKIGFILQNREKVLENFQK
jgi:hypothetical protein